MPVGTGMFRLQHKSMRLEMSEAVGADEGAAAGTGRAKYGDDDDDDDDMVVDGEGGRGAGPHHRSLSHL